MFRELLFIDDVIMENINNENENNDNPLGDAEVSPAGEPDLSGEGGLGNVDEELVEERNAEEEVDWAGSSEGRTDVGPPPPAGGFAGEDRLVRDPNAALGGVLSGIAHRYGWDVALTRLGFVVLLLISGGAGVFAYLLGWVIVPRAQYWPPVVRRRTRSISSRDVGIGLIALAALVVIGIGSGQAAAIIVPIALIVGGVWLLTQSPRAEVSADAVAFASTAPGVSTSVGGFSGGGAWTQPEAPRVEPQPVRPRSRKRWLVVVAFIAALVLIPLLLIGGFVALLASDVAVDFEETTLVEASIVEEIPTQIVEDGEYILDFESVDFGSVDSSDPLEVVVDIDFGRIEVRLPDDVEVSVQADANALGEVLLFDDEFDGLSPEAVFEDENPQLLLDLEVDFGQIVVMRG